MRSLPGMMPLSPHARHQTHTRVGHGHLERPLCTPSDVTRTCSSPIAMPPMLHIPRTAHSRTTHGARSSATVDHNCRSLKMQVWGD
jgi:hypothetical protein